MFVEVVHDLIINHLIVVESTGPVQDPDLVIADIELVILIADPAQDLVPDPFPTVLIEGETTVLIHAAQCQTGEGILEIELVY